MGFLKSLFCFQIAGIVLACCLAAAIKREGDK
jgi:hypothetical protein